MVTGGSKSLSLGTSIQPISMASGSPGEQGINKSSTIVLGSRGLGPLTFLKCVAVCTFRTGCISASRTTILISAPEYLRQDNIVNWQIYTKEAHDRGLWFEGGPFIK